MALPGLQHGPTGAIAWPYGGYSMALHGLQHVPTGLQHGPAGLQHGPTGATALPMAPAAMGIYGIVYWRGCLQAILESTTPGNSGNKMLHYFIPEITPRILSPLVKWMGVPSFESTIPIRQPHCSLPY